MGTYDTNSTATAVYTVSCTAYNSSTSTGTNTYTITIPCCYCPPPRRILVRLPGKWSKRVKLAWVKLINDDTETGWKVTMLIEGVVTVIDPNIEQRDVASMTELLKWNATEKDKKKLDAFIRKHGL